MKKVLYTQRSDTPHWVGDGFPVRTVFTYNDHGQETSPFLLLDYAGPTEFESTSKRLGVGTHPHRGFETVTIVYDGQVEHRDSAGGGGVIQAGDVQWMTAGSGLVHQEYHGQDFARTGGRFEMVQLWVNLPKQHKMTAPRYQGIRNPQIPRIELPDHSGSVSVIAGAYGETTGPAKTYSSMNVWDVRLNKGVDVEFTVPEGHNCLIFVLSGKVKVAGSHELSDAEMAILDRRDDRLKLNASEDSKVLFLGGAPLNEPIAGYGPFVMNNFQEIRQAMQDYEDGKMGDIPPIEEVVFT